MQTPSIFSPTEQPASTRSKRFEVYTEWSVSLNGSPLDPKRHAAFEHYARMVANDHLPWIFPLLEAAGSKVLIAPRSFSFELPDAPGNWIEIPAMATRLHLLPWVEAGEVAQ
jgi:hypothetical protein